jgi:hypothetical protein
MDVNVWVAYGLYLAWLVAGTGDFLCHRVTDLPHTSGVAESALHLLQLILLGSGMVLAMAFETTPLISLVLILLVMAHAAAGYVDTRTAFVRRRVILPIEQHLHSVLDMAPIVALANLLIATWPAAIDGGWHATLRTPALPWELWCAVLLPATLLCVVPALLELRAAVTASGRADFRQRRSP